MCNTPKRAVQYRITQTLETMEALSERLNALKSQLQKECKHGVVLELEDLGVRNSFSSRVCKECGLEEQVWIDEQGRSSDYKILAGEEGRIVVTGKVSELVYYKNLEHLAPQG